METENTTITAMGFEQINTHYLAVLFLGVLVLVLLPQSPLYSIETQELPVQAHIIEPQRTDIGVSTSNTTLDFGRIRQGVKATKSITITRPHFFSTITLSATGNISTFLELSPKRASSMKTETFPISLRAEETGHYKGTILIQQRTPQITILAPVMKVVPWL